MADESTFRAAAEHLTHLVGKKTKDADLLYLYARYKQVTVGDCNVPKPGIFNTNARSKWTAWNEIRGMSKDDAMRQYVDRIRLLDPSCDLSTNSSNQSGLGIAVSTLCHGDGSPTLSESEMNIFDWCKEGSLKNVKQMLASIEQVDDEKRTLLHWACDRGHLQIAEYLLDQGANVNSQDENLSTPLHYAAACDYVEVVELLIRHKADPSVKDIDEETALDCTTSKSVINLLKGTA